MDVKFIRPALTSSHGRVDHGGVEGMAVFRFFVLFSSISIERWIHGDKAQICACNRD